MIVPSALNFLTVAAMWIIAVYLLKAASSALLVRDPQSPIGRAIGVIVS